MISVLIPIKNEPYIQYLVRKIHKVLKTKHEIIVMDKSDFPPKLVGAKLIRRKSIGLGDAILEGLSYTSGEIVLVMDGDGSHRPEDIPNLLEKIDDFDIVIGSRFIDKGKIEDVIYRKILSFIFTKFASKILNLKIKDSMSHFTMFKKDILRNLTLRPLGYRVIMEIIFKAKHAKICEVPIVFERRKAGKSKTDMIEALRTLRYITELKFGLR